MGVSLPYLASNKNLESLFSAIESAKVPDRFTHEFLTKTIGLKGSNDRALIPLLRTLGFVDQSSTPTSAYRQLKNRAAAKDALATAVKKAYAPLFEANEEANALSAEKLKGLIAQVAGTDSDMTARIANTFNALAKLADFSHIEGGDPADELANETADQERITLQVPKYNNSSQGPSMAPEFHYNIQVHLPSNGTEEVYLAIFNALRKVFQ